jgi:hypothetical protein
MPAAAPAIPENPRTAAISAITRNISAHLNMAHTRTSFDSRIGGLMLPLCAVVVCKLLSFNAWENVKISCHQRTPSLYSPDKSSKRIL